MTKSKKVSDRPSIINTHSGASFLPAWALMAKASRSVGPMVSAPSDFSLTVSHELGLFPAATLILSLRSVSLGATGASTPQCA